MQGVLTLVSYLLCSRMDMSSDSVLWLCTWPYSKCHCWINRIYCGFQGFLLHSDGGTQVGHVHLAIITNCCYSINNMCFVKILNQWAVCYLLANTCGMINLAMAPIRCFVHVHIMVIWWLWQTVPSALWHHHHPKHVLLAPYPTNITTTSV